MKIYQRYPFWFAISNLAIVLLAYLLSLFTKSNMVYLFIGFGLMLPVQIVGTFLFANAKRLFSLATISAFITSVSLTNAFFYNQDKLVLYCNDMDSVLQQYKEYEYLNTQSLWAEKGLYGWTSNRYKTKNQPIRTEALIVVPVAYPKGVPGQPFYFLHKKAVKTGENTQVEPVELDKAYADALEVLPQKRQFFIRKAADLERGIVDAAASVMPPGMKKEEVIILEEYPEESLSPLQLRMVWRIVLVVFLVVFNLLLIGIFKKTNT